MDCGLALVACSRCGGVDGVIRGCGSVVRVRICGFVALLFVPFLLFIPLFPWVALFP